MGANQLIELVPYSEEDHYQELCFWWDAHGSVRAERQDLSSGIGLVACDHQGPLGACFLYVTGSIGFIEAMVIHPGARLSTSREIADQLFKAHEAKAKDAGVTKLIAFVASKGMVRECQRGGFTQVGPTMAQMVQAI